MFFLRNIVQNGLRPRQRSKLYLFLQPNAIKQCANIHNTVAVNLKMYMENENKYAYSVMEKNGYAANLSNDYNHTYVKENYENIFTKDWSKEKPQSLFQTLSNLGTYCAENNICISDKRFDTFIDSLTDNIKYATEDELKSMFYSLANIPETHSIRTRNFIEIWAALDDECLNRMHTMNFDDMLSYISLFYLINVTRYSDFTFKCLQRIAGKAKRLTKAQLVQTMFFIGVKRVSPHDMHNLEIYIEDHFSEFNIDELAVSSMGFFKSKTPIRNVQLVKNIIRKIIQESENVHEVSLAALLKVIRYSLKIPVDDTVYELLESLQQQVPRLSIMCNVHIALVGTSTLTLHKSCLSKIAGNTLNSMSNTRLKDLERLVLSFGTFNYIPETKNCFLTKVVEELKSEKRLEEIKKHGQSYACCLAYLGLLNVYPQELMKRVLNKEFLEKAYGKHCYTYGREVLTLHNASKIFFKDENISELSDKQVQTLAKKYTDFVPNENFNKQYNVAEKMFLDVKKILQEVRGEKFVTTDHILCHHQRGDIVICNDDQGLPVPVDNAFAGQKFGTIHHPPNDKTWIVLIIAGKNAMIQNTVVPTGHFTSKTRELKELGFHSAIVSYNIYSKYESQDEKVEYLNKLINEAINNKK